ncbi:membrane cofactor protein-like [Melanotaenia boesemani]|uniref:membrane cofactor protein-like n=1 Tax=Melanotaenia boesemani TaxID=1250792 RepID=UPI001C042A0A|nr:membrane cofactor protein-like [Melanotaenia boesemani]
MGVSALFLLSSLGLAVLAQAQDCSKPELGPTMILSHEDIIKNTFPDGSKATLKCGIGHESAGGSRTITCTAGSWSSVTLKCEKKNCGSAGSVDNGDINYEGTEFGDKAMVVCRKGYRMIGNPVLACGDQGWMGRLPTCEVVKCINPPQIQNGDFIPKLESYDFGHVVKYSCVGTYILNGSKELTCSETGGFSPSPPKCVCIECKDPEIPNAEIVNGSQPPHGPMASVTYKCKDGYEMSTSLTCDINSQWSPGTPQCIKRKSCGSAGSVDNGDINYEGTEFGDKATVVCRKGYRMIGNPVLLCGDQGWMGRLPTCEVVRCINPPQIQNGDFVPKLESYDFGHVVKYSCDATYTLNGSKELTCSETENFSPSPPKCVLVRCNDPAISNGEFVDGSRPPHGYMASMTFRCKNGYEMEGSPSLTCGINSQWLPGIPQCIKTMIPTTKATTTTTKKPSEASSTTKATTTSTPDTKKPAGVTPKPDDPHGGSNALPIGLGITAVVVVIAIIIGVFYYRGKKGRFQIEGRRFSTENQSLLTMIYLNRNSPVGPALLNVRSK